MRLFFTVTNDLNYDQRMQRICHSLSKAGYQVMLIGRMTKNSKTLDNQIFRQKRLPCFFQKGKFFYLEYNLRLFFFLLFQGFDAICAIDLDTILPCFWVTHLRRKPCIYDAHEYFSEVPEVVRRPFIKKIWERIANYTIPKLKYCYTVSKTLAEVLSIRYGVPFAVIRNMPVKTTYLIKNPPEKYPVFILYQGVLNEGRGLEQTIEAMQYLEGIELWLAGEGDLSQFLRNLVYHLNLEQKVRFLGYQSPTLLKALTPHAFIGLNLLKNNGLSYYYSLANKFFDYIQAQVPSLNMDFPEYRHLNDQYQVGILMPNLDPKNIAKCIYNLLNDKILYNKLKQNCCIAQEILTWEEEEKILLNFYNNIKF